MIMRLTFIDHFVPDTVLSTLPVLCHLIFVTVINDGCWYHIHFPGKGIKSMNIMFTLWGPQPCVKQGQVDSGAPAFNHSPHHLLGAHEEPGPHRGPCKKSDTVVHFRRGPRGLDTYKCLANAPPPLPVETTPFFPELIIAYSLQIALLDFLWVCF